MSIGFDAFSKSGASVWTTSTSFTHTPVGTPRGIVIFVVQNGNDADGRGTVTYGGVSVTAVDHAEDTATEFMASYSYFLGSSIPTGPQTVEFSGWSADDHYAWVISLTAAADTTVEAHGIAEENLANPVVALSTTAETWAAGVLISGLGSQGSLAATTGFSKLGVAGTDSFDFGQQVALVETGDALFPAGTVNVGWTSAIDDVAMCALAIKEVAGAAATSLIATARDRRLPARRSAIGRM